MRFSYVGNIHFDMSVLCERKPKVETIEEEE
jgi:hypothetical protein